MLVGGEIELYTIFVLYVAFHPFSKFVLVITLCLFSVKYLSYIFSEYLIILRSYLNSSSQFKYLLI